MCVQILLARWLASPPAGRATVSLALGDDDRLKILQARAAAGSSNTNGLPAFSLPQAVACHLVDGADGVTRLASTSPPRLLVHPNGATRGGFAYSSGTAACGLPGATSISHMCVSTHRCTCPGTHVGATLGVTSVGSKVLTAALTTHTSG